MNAMTEQELEEAVAHDMKIFLESMEERGIQDPDDQEDRQFAAFDARLSLLEARLDVKIQAVRTDLMRWTLMLFCAGTISAALIMKR